MTQPNGKKDIFANRTAQTFGCGFWVVVLVFGLVRCVSGDPNISSAQKERYDSCMAEKRKLGVGFIKADEICDFWKRADP